MDAWHSFVQAAVAAIGPVAASRPGSPASLAERAVAVLGPAAQQRGGAIERILHESAAAGAKSGSVRGLRSATTTAAAGGGRGGEEGEALPWR